MLTLNQRRHLNMNMKKQFQKTTNFNRAFEWSLVSRQVDSGCCEDALTLSLRPHYGNFQ